jgi:6-phosphogluconolactonase
MKKPDDGGGLMRVTALDRDALHEAAASVFVNIAAEAVARRGVFTTALSGGTTPKPLYSLLARDYRDKIDWLRTQVFFSDERCVPPDDPLSNYRMIRETLLDQAPIPPENVHRMRGEIEPTDAAIEYTGGLRGALDLSAEQDRKSVV